MFIQANIWSQMIQNTIWLQEKLQHRILFDSYDLWNLDKGVSYGTLAYYIMHGFLIFKLNTYGFIHEALNVMKNYLSDKTHGTNKTIIVAANFSICY